MQESAKIDRLFKLAEASEVIFISSKAASCKTTAFKIAIKLFSSRWYEDEECQEHPRSDDQWRQQT